MVGMYVCMHACICIYIYNYTHIYGWSRSKYVDNELIVEKVSMCVCLSIYVKWCICLRILS